MKAKGYMQKLHNRRVSVWKIDDGWHIKFKTMVDDDKPTCVMRHTGRKGKNIMTTNIAISDEAMDVLIEMVEALIRTKMDALLAELHIEWAVK